VRLLLDTHTFLWFVMGDARLSARARALIEDRGNERLLSLASLWEMAIKHRLGKLSLTEPFDTLIPGQLDLTGVRLLDIRFSHITVVSALPLHHRDPFDRMLIAQAIIEESPLLSADSAFDAYRVTRIW
jgi:PIN domain nuclease of toxin-antitoxin system